MPELPEVEFYRTLLAENLFESTIELVEICHNSRVFKNIDMENFDKIILHKKVIDVQRYGKYIWFCLDGNLFLTFHFGMTGFIEVRGQPRLRYKTEGKLKDDSMSWPPRCAALKLGFKNLSTGKECEVAYCDPRKFGNIFLFKDQPERSSPISHLGFDPLTNWPKSTNELFLKKVRQRSVPLKTLLLDQRFVAGIGNWMADDILLEAKLLPSRRTSDIQNDEVRNLHKAIYKISSEGVKTILSKEEYPIDWLFHKRWARNKQKMFDKDGNKIEVIKVGGRTTLFVPSNQK